MTLTTRCPACGTVFRVVEDQLRVSEGWVRCGHCQQAFDGRACLVDLTQPPTAPSPAPPSPPASVRDESPDPSPRDTEPPAAVWVPSRREPAGPGPDSIPTQPARTAPTQAPTEDEARTGLPPADPTPTTEPSPDALPRWTSGASEAIPLDAGLSLPPDDGLRGDPRWAAPIAAAPNPPMPGFVRRADQAQRWRRPAVRRSLAALVVIALAVLLMQIGVIWRDTIAARWPATRTGLDLLCRVWGCTIEAPRWIDALVIDSSGLVRIDGTDRYRLNAVLRNRAATPLAVPALDLVLKDIRGSVVARRTLSAAELGVPSSEVPPLGELDLRGTLQVRGQSVAGYTIEIFYP